MESPPWAGSLPVALVSAGLAAAVLLFTVIKFFADNEARHWPAWVGLVLARVIGYGGWMRYSAAEENAPATPLPEPPAA